MVLRNFGENLDKIECPLFPGILLGVGKAVVPCLEFVQQKHGRALSQHFDNELVGGYIRLTRPHTFPFALDVGAMGVPLEQQIPKKLVAVPVQALTDDQHAAAKGDCPYLRVAKGACP
ncbi:hypothetical protein DSECCO2_651140 [anaerobic digester metagenome]